MLGRLLGEAEYEPAVVRRRSIRPKTSRELALVEAGAYISAVLK